MGHALGVVPKTAAALFQTAAGGSSPNGMKANHE
eukprot:CAMPEP_0178988490 /NCGR_PEP_ID=MMETSP0795-20121207/3838_1 /TAXON_ID=88552 /ORGANISM="Amoebophrya sp., Strain Ameob2" /LENGTH=33 /DNA_ID= /DNA_START= /DNA_END= /DNA_ORIENTATION=